MYRSLRLRLVGLLFIGLITAACSSEEPAAPAATAPETAAPEPAAEAPATDAPAAEAAAPADEESVALAQAMDEAETDGEAAAESEESIHLATADTPEPAVNERFKDGTHYRTLPVAQPTSAAPDKVEVVEVFWYGCPHCYTLEPHIKAWKADMPANAQFVRMPASLNRGWQIHARVFARNGQWFVEDLGSTNGTFVGDDRVAGPRVVRPGEWLRVGSFVFEVEA